MRMRFKVTRALAVLATGVIVAAPSIAFAKSDSAGGTGGVGAVGAHAHNSKRWVLLSTTKGGRTAWQKLIGDRGYYGAGSSEAHARDTLKRNAAQNVQWIDGKVRAITSGKTGNVITYDQKGKRVGVRAVPLYGLCQQSQYIWMLSSYSTGRPSNNAINWSNQQVTWPTFNGKNALSDAVPVHGSSFPAGATKQKLIDIVWSMSSKRPQSMVLVCSDSEEGLRLDKPTPTPTKPSPKPTPTSTPTVPPVTPPNGNTPVTGSCGVRHLPDVRDNKSGVWVDDYSWSVMVTPQILQNGIDPIGENNLHAQAGTPKKTNFGVLKDQVSGGTKLTLAEMEKRVADARAKDMTEPRATVNLDEANRKGLAEGGVLNVSEYTQPAQITVTENWVEKWAQSCNYSTYTTTSKDANGKTVTTTRTVEVWSSPYRYDRILENVDNSTSQASLFNSAFWQILSVHCNPLEYAAARVAAGATEEPQADGRLSSVMYSRVYRANTPVSSSGSAASAAGTINGSTSSIKNYGPVPAQPAVLDFGDATNTSPALSRTAQLGFYDKECPFTCTSSSTGTGSGEGNGSASNIGSSKPKGEGATVRKYGAVSGATNDNKFEFFRDNTNHRITADVWYPVSNGAVDYDGHSALTTTITRWSKGTPGINSSSGGRFTMTTESGEEVFVTGGTVKSQRNWSEGSESLFKSETSSQLSGLHRNFDMKASWASETDRPQILNIRWEYAPQVRTRFAADGIGFGTAGSAARTGTPATESAAIQGKCFANYGTSTGNSFDALVQRYTGTGTTNGIDGKLVEGEPATPADADTNLFIRFLRATTE